MLLPREARAPSVDEVSADSETAEQRLVVVKVVAPGRRAARAEGKLARGFASDRGPRTRRCRQNSAVEFVFVPIVPG